MKKVAAVALRGGALAARFGLTLMMAAYLTPDEAGFFGLYWTAIVLASGLLGMDVYAYSTRVFLAKNEDGIIERHSGFVALASVVLVPCAAFLFFIAVARMPVYMLLFFPVHLTLEFIAQEVGRFLVVENKVFESNVVLFVRTASWIPFGLFAIFMSPGKELFIFFVSWAVGSAGAVALCCIYEPRFFLWRSLHIDFPWIWRAVKSSMILFASTLLFRAILGLDKFIVNAALGVEVVGIYAVHASIALGILSLTEAGVSAWRYPGLVTAIQLGKKKEVRGLLKKFQREAVVSSIVVGVVAALVVPYLLKYAGRPQYTEDMTGFYMIVLGTVMYSLSMPSHYVVYGFKKDGWLLGIYITGLLGLGLAAILFLKALGLTGAGLMLCAALTLVALSRFAVSRFLLRSL